MKAGIISSGLGNVSSIRRMLERVGATSVYVSSGTECIGCDSLILPSVGHFDEGVRLLRNADL